MSGGTRETWARVNRLPEGTIYPELLHGGLTETLRQNTNIFNQASLNCIRLITNRRIGDVSQSSTFRNVDNLISRRVVEENSPSNAAVTPESVPMDEEIIVKLNRRIGPIDQTFDSFRKIGKDATPEVISFAYGQQIGKAVQIDQADTALRALSAAIGNQAALTISQGPVDSPQATLDTDDLIDALARFGDAADRIKCWVMHSKPFYDLVREQLATDTNRIQNFVYANASPVTLNRPVIVIDSADLADDSTSSPLGTFEYTTLGLVEGACLIEDSEEEVLYADIISGNQNLVNRMQGEFAYNMQLKGFKWDTANGGMNPNNQALRLGTNWDANRSSEKDLAGVAIRSL